MVSSSDLRDDAMEPIAMWDHILDACDLRETVAKSTGLPNDEALAKDLCGELNAGWWVAFHTKEEPPRSYTVTLRILEDAFVRSCFRRRS